METTYEALKKIADAFSDVQAIRLSRSKAQITALESLLGDIERCSNTLKVCFIP